MYNTQDYWGFGLCPSSGILEARKHNVSETALRLALSKGPNRVGVFPPHLGRKQIQFPKHCVF
jgi:hypothetical protein